MNYKDLLNPEQYEAVIHNKGPLLILAGAGSGKTRVLTYRIAYLIEHHNVNPWNILALTFTNKAAKEMRDRVDNIIGYNANQIWVSTFHSTCVRMLRRYISSLGYTESFNIYDSADQKTLIKEVCKYLDLDTKKFKDRTIMNKISAAKDKLMTPEDMLKAAEGDYLEKKYAQIYEEYQKQLFKNNALDFDDLIFKTVELFRTNPEALSYYQNRFKYILVDEYQDTNHAQFVLINMLASTTDEYGVIERNLCVVGDDDQSIYSFRGADITNILEFEDKYADAKVIKLEQNYRSTKAILNAANEVISNNFNRKRKSLWTNNEDGEPISHLEFNSGYDEADYIAKTISKACGKGDRNYNDYAILYRTNAQSRLLEEKFIQYNIPYKLIGGTNFYSRKEIKDVLAYLRVISNPQDDIQIKRIINVPKRGIGATTISKVTEYAFENEMSFYNAAANAKGIPGMGKAATKLEAFCDLIKEFQEFNKDKSNNLTDLFSKVMEITGYVSELEVEDTVEAKTRIENIQEFVNKIVDFDELMEDETEYDGPALLNMFLEEVSLVADIDRYDESEDTVTLMTIHGSKGLEFPYVFLAGMEEGLFPSYQTISSGDPDDVDEERRLCYVGITRAQSELILTSAKLRMINGENQFHATSRFIREIPRYMLKQSSDKKFDAFTSVSDFNSPFTTTKPNNSSDLFADNPFIKKGFSGSFSSLDSKKPKQSSAPVTIDYSVGDDVEHIKFGKGNVLDMEKKGPKDYIVTIDFEGIGTRKLVASVAKLKKI